VNFCFSREEERFRAEVREFLSDYRGLDGFFGQDQKWDRVKELFRAMGERGWLALAWPKKFGGLAKGPAYEYILWDEFGYARAARNPLAAGVVARTLIRHGSREQKDRWLPPIRSGELHFSLAYSEPEAGSDLASLQTRAVLDGEHYIINGSKIWTTNAHHSDWMFCLVRTDPDAAKHDGISFILFDMKQPGVEVQPIELISGSSEFCQVFFGDVRAKAKNLVGTENGGWTIAKRLLQHGRSMLARAGGGGPVRRRGAGKGEKPKAPKRDQLAKTLAKYTTREDGRIADPALRARVAQLELDQLCFALTMKRSGEEARSAQGPDTLSSMSKFYASEMNKRRQEITVSAMGSNALGWDGDAFEPGDRLQTRAWLRSKGNSIEGGTSEVQLNIISKRVLGLPD